MIILYFIGILSLYTFYYCSAKASNFHIEFWNTCRYKHNIVSFYCFHALYNNIEWVGCLVKLSLHVMNITHEIDIVEINCNEGTVEPLF